MRTFRHRLLGLARPRGFTVTPGVRLCEGARTVFGPNAAIRQCERGRVGCGAIVLFAIPLRRRKDRPNRLLRQLHYDPVL